MEKSKKNVSAVDQKDRIWNILPSFKHWIYLAKTKGCFKSENVEGFVNLPKNIPKNYLKFLHPIHDIDKTSILIFFFTLQV